MREMSVWERISIEELIARPLRVVRERVRTQNGAEIDYVYRTGPVEAALILPVTGRGTGLFLKEYRHPTRKFLFAIPAGAVNPGESAEAAARRELLEETGASSDEILPLAPFHPQPSFSAVLFRPFLAFGAKVVAAPRHEPGEWIETQEAPLAEAYARLARGEIEDAPTALTLFYARDELARRGLL